MTAVPVRTAVLSYTIRRKGRFFHEKIIGLFKGL